MSEKSLQEKSTLIAQEVLKKYKIKIFVRMYFPKKYS